MSMSSTSWNQAKEPGPINRRVAWNRGLPSAVPGHWRPRRSVQDVAFAFLSFVSSLSSLVRRSESHDVACTLANGPTWTVRPRPLPRVSRRASVPPGSWNPRNRSGALFPTERSSCLSLGARPCAPLDGRDVSELSRNGRTRVRKRRVRKDILVGNGDAGPNAQKKLQKIGEKGADDVEESVVACPGSNRMYSSSGSGPLRPIGTITASVRGGYTTFNRGGSFPSVVPRIAPPPLGYPEVGFERRLHSLSIGRC